MIKTIWSPKGSVPEGYGEVRKPKRIRVSKPLVERPAKIPAKRVRPPAPPPEGAFDPQHHLIYAAMIDGCIGQGALAARLGLSHADVKNVQRVLCKRGYIKMGWWNHHKAYVPVEIDAGDKL